MMPIEAEIKQFILKNFLFTDDPAVLADHDSLLEQGAVDSTGMLELVNHIEATYGIKVADAEMTPDNLDTVASIAGFVTRKRGR